MKLFIEGEEEAGLASFVSFLNTTVKNCPPTTLWLQTPLTGVLAYRTDHQLYAASSGDIEVRVGSHAIHSGMFGGPMLDAHTSWHSSSPHCTTPPALQLPKAYTAPRTTRIRRSRLPQRLRNLLTPYPWQAPVSVSRLWTQPAISVIGMDIPPSQPPTPSPSYPAHASAPA